MLIRHFRLIAACLMCFWLSLSAVMIVAADEKPSKRSSRILSSASELDYPPFALVRNGDTADGFSVDLLKAVCRAVGLDITFKVGPWHVIKNDLAEGRLDILPLVAYSVERDKVFDFTAPYLRMRGTIFVRKGDRTIQSETDLKDKEVLVMRDDMAHEYAVRNNLTEKLILTESFESAMKQLSAGKHDAVIAQHLVGLQLIKKLGIDNVVSVRSFHESSLKPDANPLSGFEQKICIAVKDGDKELLANLNEGLSLVITDGVYDELYDKWFGPILPEPVVSPARIARYLVYILVPLLALIGISYSWLLKREVARKTDIIKENEEKFSIVFNKAPFPVSLSRFNDGVLVDVNESWTEAAGIDRADAIGRTTETLGLSTNPEERDRIYSQLKAHGSVRRMELTGYRTKTNLSPVVLADLELIEIGGETYVFASVLDITEQKRAEAALRQSEEHLRRAQEIAHLGSWELDPQSNALTWSDEVFRIFGIQPQTFRATYEAFLAAVHPDDRRKVDKAYSSSLQDNRDSYEIEHRVVRPDGTIRHVHEKCEHFRDSSGRIVRSVGMVHDITERKKAEAALRRLSQFPEENPNPVLRITLDGTLLYMNAAARNVLAVLNWQDGRPLPSELNVAVERVREQGRAVETEIAIPDGRAYSFFAIQPLNEGYINLYGMDFSERKRAENALRDSEKRLKSSLTEKEVLLKEIHHRVKNNMQVISSLVDLQADEVDDDATRSIFQDVVFRVRSMAMVHEKLYQSKDLAQVEFADYTETLLGYLWRAQKGASSGIQLDLELAPVFLPVNLAVPCGLVLNELFSNALKHAFNGRDSGRVMVSLSEDADGQVNLEVRDDGIGLPPEFDWQKANSLGLRLVQMLARQLHATVAAKSDAGTVFTITFKRPNS